MTKLSLLAPLSAVLPLLLLLGPDRVQGHDPAPTRAELDATVQEAVEVYRSERSLESAAGLLDAALLLEDARRGHGALGPLDDSGCGGAPDGCARPATSSEPPLGSS